MNGADRIEALQHVTLDKELAYALALQAAIRDRDRDAVAALLKLGADVNWQNAFGEAALFVCSNYDSRNGRDLTADIVVAHPRCNINLPDKFGMTPLNNAVLRGRHPTANIIRNALRW
jgi:ankyrin repeat protein